MPREAKPGGAKDKTQPHISELVGFPHDMRETYKQMYKKDVQFKIKKLVFEDLDAIKKRKEQKDNKPKH